MSMTTIPFSVHFAHYVVQQDFHTFKRRRYRSESSVIYCAIDTEGALCHIKIVANCMLSTIYASSVWKLPAARHGDAYVTWSIPPCPISRARGFRRKLLLVNSIEVLPLVTPSRYCALFPIVVHERLESNWVFFLILKILTLPLPICILFRTFDVFATAQAPTFSFARLPA